MKKEKTKELSETLNRSKSYNWEYGSKNEDLIRAVRHLINEIIKTLINVSEDNKDEVIEAVKLSLTASGLLDGLSKRAGVNVFGGLFQEGKMNDKNQQR